MSFPNIKSFINFPLPAGNPSSLGPLPPFQTLGLSSSKYSLLMFWCWTHTCCSLESLVPVPTHFAWYISISNPYSGFSSSLAFFPIQNHQYWITLLTYLLKIYNVLHLLKYNTLKYSIAIIIEFIFLFHVYMLWYIHVWWTYVYICEAWGWRQESSSIVLLSYSLRKDHSIKPRAHRYSRILTVNS